MTVLPFVHGLDCPLVGWSQRNERNSMMNHTDGWMSSWAGGGMWIWAVLGVAVVVLLVVVIIKLSKK
jgi:anti-sigma-K factor RskA